MPLVDMVRWCVLSDFPDLLALFLEEHPVGLASRSRVQALFRAGGVSFVFVLASPVRSPHELDQPRRFLPRPDPQEDKDQKTLSEGRLESVLFLVLKSQPRDPVHDQRIRVRGMHARVHIVDQQREEKEARNGSYLRQARHTHARATDELRKVDDSTETVRRLTKAKNLAPHVVGS